MSVAIIVLNYNDNENTKKYVNQIEDYKIVDKILVVDNKSTNKEELKKLSTLKSKKVEIISSDKNGGYAYGNNYGIKYLDKVYRI